MIVAIDEGMHARAQALFAAAQPHRVAELASWREPGVRRWVAVDGDIVGYCAAWRVHDRKFRIDVVVDPAHRRRGLGTAMLEHVIAAARADNAHTVQARPSAADPASLAFAAKRQFAETMRMHFLELALADARHGEFHELMDRLAGEGIAIVTIADFLARSRDGDAAYRDVVESAREGWPDPDPDLPGESSPKVDWTPMIRESTHAIVAEQHSRASRSSSARIATRLVGFTNSIGTGVRPEMRGRGIATALKVAAIDAALARGETIMRTASGNPAMRHINEKLGFRETSCEVRMVRSALP